MDRGVRIAASAWVVACGWALVFAGLPAAAQSVPGAVLAAPCAACHGPDGVSPGAIPSINGLDAATMARRMRELRNAGNEATVMNRIARGYTDAEIDALAQYFAAQKR